MDWTLDKYKELLKVIKKKNYPILTLKEYFIKEKTNQLPTKFFILRHDVDISLNKAQQMIDTELYNMVRSTYNIRIKFSHIGFDIEILQKLVEDDFEIGYHYEDYSKAKGNVPEARRLFLINLDWLRRISKYNVITSSMHGNPLSKWDNKDFWKYNNLKFFNLLGDGYYTIPFDTLDYLSDTGRTWEEGVRNTYDNVSSSLDIKTTDELINYIENGINKPLYLLVHPERWNNFGYWYCKILLRDLIAGTIKTMLKYVRK